MGSKSKEIGGYMNTSKITVEVSVNQEDIYNFQKAVLFKNISPGFFIIISIIFLLIAAAAIIEKPPFGRNPAFAIILILISAFFLIGIPSAFKRGAANAFKTNKLLQKTQKYEIGDAGIEVSSESGQGFVKWDEIYKATETKDSFLFFISKQQAYVIPKRSFNENAQDIEFLRKYMKAAPSAKEDKFLGIFKKGLGWGCIIYILLFFVILIILLLYSTK